MCFRVQKAAVNLLAGKAEVQYNPDVTGPRHLIHAVQDAGFEAQLLRGDRHVSTFACSFCLHQCRSRPSKYFAPMLPQVH